MADIISRLKLESGEFDSKIKRAAQGITQMVAEARKMNSTLISAAGNTEEEVKANMKYIQSLGRMETVSQTARGKLAELTAGFTDLKHAYNQLSQEEKSGNVGRELNKQLEILKQRIAESKNEIKGIEQELNGSNSKFGEFGNIIDTIGSKFGVSGNLTEMLTSRTAMLTGAVGAGIAIVTKATEAWAGYNAELAKQDQITTVTTGLKGDAADQMTNQARALVDTYNVDFRESINAANTLMTQFGVTGEQAMQLIKDGMQGMIQGDGPKLLQMIQQYAPAFRDAGVSASQLVAVIQNSEGGIFTDQNMNAIVMGIKNIRLMTKATSDALAQLGIDGQKMSQQLSDGSMTIFDALKQVAGAISNVDSNSKAAGEVMQQVFGRQGVTAGTNLGKAIETLNTNLEETKKQTGEVGEAFNELYEANLRLNTAIRDAFGYDGWEQMATGIKTTLIGALSDVIEHLAIIRQGFKDIANFFGGGNKAPAGKGYEDVDKTQQWINNGKDDNERRRRYEKAIADLQNKLNNVGKEYAKRNADGSTSFIIDDAETQAKKRDAIRRRMKMLYATSYTPEVETPKPIEPTKTNKSVSSSTKEVKEVVGLIGTAESRIKGLQKQISESWDLGEIARLRKELKDAQNDLDVMQGKLPKDTVAEIHVKANIDDAIQKVKDIEGVTIEPKTFAITVTDEAMPKLREIQGVTIDPKTSVITATDEAMPMLREIQGVTIEPKTLTITANTTDALQKVQELVSDIDYTVVIPVTTDEHVERSIRQRYGKPVEMPVVPKTAGEQLEQQIRISIAESNIDADMATLTSLLETQIKNGIEGIDIPTDELIQKIMGDGINIPDEYWEGLQTQINDKLKELGIDAIKIDFKTGNISSGGGKKDNATGKQLDKFNSEFSKVPSGVSSIVSGIQQMGVEIPSEIQSVLGVLTGISSIMTGIVALLTLIEIDTKTTAGASVFDAIIPLARGGIVPKAAGGRFIGGNSYSGDNIFAGNAWVNSGELVLNKAQQSTLASQLEGGGMQGMKLSAVISGEQIRLVLNNNGRRTGKGEYVQTNFR